MLQSYKTFTTLFLPIFHHVLCAGHQTADDHHLHPERLCLQCDAAIIAIIDSLDLIIKIIFLINSISNIVNTILLLTNTTIFTPDRLDLQCDATPQSETLGAR